MLALGQVREGWGEEEVGKKGIHWLRQGRNGGLLDHSTTLVLVYIVYYLQLFTCGMNLTVLDWSYTDGPVSLVVVALDLIHT